DTTSTAEYGLYFCCVDGDHAYDVVKVDFHNCDSFLEAGGFRLFDDSSVADVGVGRLLPEVLKTKKYRLIGKNPDPDHLFRRRTMKREHPALVLAHSRRSLNSAVTWLSEALERHKGAV